MGKKSLRMGQVLQSCPCMGNKRLTLDMYFPFDYGSSRLYYILTALVRFWTCLRFDKFVTGIYKHLNCNVDIFNYLLM